MRTGGKFDRAQGSRALLGPRMVRVLRVLRVLRASRAIIMTGCCLPALLAMTGCGAGQRVRTMNLGPVGIDAAFTQARGLLAGRFVIDESDAEDHTLLTEWQYNSDESGRTFQVTRQRARLTLRREGGATWADLRIPVERMLTDDEMEARRFLERRLEPENAHALTPAMLDAPYSLSQRAAWRVIGCNTELELELLSALYHSLNPTQP